MTNWEIQFGVLIWSLSSTGILRRSFSLLFSWTLAEYYGREGSSQDVLAVTETFHFGAIAGVTYRCFCESGRVVVNVRQRNGGRRRCAQTIRSAVQVHDLNWDQVSCLSLKGIWTKHKGWWESGLWQKTKTNFKVNKLNIIVVLLKMIRVAIIRRQQFFFIFKFKKKVKFWDLGQLLENKTFFSGINSKFCNNCQF